VFLFVSRGIIFIAVGCEALVGQLEGKNCRVCIIFFLLRLSVHVVTSASTELFMCVVLYCRYYLGKYDSKSSKHDRFYYGRCAPVISCTCEVMR
jgi:hypothetical protein